MSHAEVIVRSRKGRLILQFIAITACSIVLGLLLEAWDVIDRSPLGKLGTETGLPLVALTVFILGVLIAVFILRDKWSREYVFHQDNLEIRQWNGRSKIRYSTIVTLRLLVPRGVGIWLRDPEEWLASFEGPDRGRRTLRRMSAGWKTLLHCDVAVFAGEIDISVGEFAGLLLQKIDQRQEGGATPEAEDTGEPVPSPSDEAKPETAKKIPTPKWSALLSGEFNVTLPPDVEAWFDEEKWKECASTEFGMPDSPEHILDPHGAAVWGGQMLPDTIPILGNGGGDVLCLRFGFDGSVVELIEWRHVGGFWHPVGKSITEALIYDAARITMREGAWDLTEEEDPFVLAEWAFRRHPMLSGEAESFDAFAYENRRFGMEALLPAGIAGEAVRRDIAKECLTTRLERLCIEKTGESLSRKVGVTFEEMYTWLFDPRLVPDPAKRKLSRMAQVTERNLLEQDLDAAETAAQAVLEKRKDLAWPYNVAGWVAERRGDVDAAIGIYMSGLESFGSTDDFTEGWSWPSMTRGRKYIVRRLKSLADEGHAVDREHPYLQAGFTPIDAENPVMLPARNYWLERAKAHEDGGEYAEAYQCYYAVGWDEFATDDMKELLDHLVRTAEAAGSAPLHTLASLHLKTVP